MRLLRARAVPSALPGRARARAREEGFAETTWSVGTLPRTYSMNSRFHAPLLGYNRASVVPLALLLNKY